MRQQICYYACDGGLGICEETSPEVSNWVAAKMEAEREGWKILGNKHLCPKHKERKPA